MATKSVVSRQEWFDMQQFCPIRPVVELEVPESVGKVLSVTFECEVRDQGWSSEVEDFSWTWCESSIQRPKGRDELRPFQLFQSRGGQPTPEKYSAIWSQDMLCPARRRIITELQPGDIIQIIPRAKYFAWVNIVTSATITLTYDIALQQPVQPVTETVLKTPLLYKEIESSKGETRILTILPGKRDEEIRCLLDHYILSDALEFDALSYCWGSATGTEGIIIHALAASGFQDSYTNISNSVAEALRYLRHPDRPFRVWVDQVCVNQNDLRERAEQVNIMSDIYSKASTIHVWLGTEDHPVTAAMRFARDVYNYSEQVCPGGELCRCTITKHTASIKAIDDMIKEKGSPSFKSMYEIFSIHSQSFSAETATAASGLHNAHSSYLMSCLFSKPWFRRVWVVQEVLLAGNALVHCGPETIPWDEVTKVNEWFTDERIGYGEGHLARPVHMPFIFSTLKRKSSDEERPPILDVFLKGLSLNATDPRDHLFALLSFGRETWQPSTAPSELRPSYTKPFQMVLADFTRWHIQKHQSLSILSLVHGQHKRAWVRLPSTSVKDIDLPSWVIGGNFDMRSAKTTLDSLFDFNASAGTKPLENLLGPSNHKSLVLCLDGYKITQIDEVAHLSIYPISPTNASDPINSLLVVFDHLFRPCDHSSRLETWKPADEGHSKALVSEPCSMISTRLQWTMDHLRAHWGYREQPAMPAIVPRFLGGKNPELKRFESRGIFTCLDPSLMIAANGMVGLCPWTAKKGDLIVVLNGGKVPYLLRRSTESRLVGEERYTLIGECFVTGIMDGEYHKAQTASGRVLDRFSIV